MFLTEKILFVFTKHQGQERNHICVFIKYRPRNVGADGEYQSRQLQKEVDHLVIQLDQQGAHTHSRIQNQAHRKSVLGQRSPQEPHL